MIPMGVIGRLVRSTVLEVISQEFPTALAAKGLRRRRIVFHVLKNAAPPALAVMGIIEKDFIYEQRQLMLATNFIQSFAFFRARIRSRGIIRIEKNNGTTSWVDEVRKGMKIDLPTVVVDEGIRNELYVVKISKKFEEGIAGRGDQDFIIRICQ